MGNICSTVEGKTKRGAKAGNTKKQKADRKRQSTTSTAKSSPKGKNAIVPPGTTSHKAPATQFDVPSAEVPNPLHDDSRTRLSSITESSHSDLRSIRSQLQRKADAQQQQASAAQKDTPLLSDAKLGLVRSWIDVIEKRNLLDPQDVTGYERRHSGGILSKPVSNKRGSIALSIQTAEIRAEPGSQPGSMAVGKGGSCSSRSK